MTTASKAHPSEHALETAATVAAASASGNPDNCQASLTEQWVADLQVRLVDTRRQLALEPDPLATLAALAGLADAIDAAIDVAAKEARRAGASWQAIGKAAGITRQSAHDRWREPRSKPGAGESSSHVKPQPRPASASTSSSRSRKGGVRFRGVTLRAGVEVTLERDKGAARRN